MATAIACGLCDKPLALHCPQANSLCDWFTCRTVGCTAYIYDLHRGLLRHRDGHVESWADQADPDAEAG